MSSPIIGTLPFNIQAGQLVSAAPVMGNYNFIANQVNANAVPLTGPATLTGSFTINGAVSAQSLTLTAASPTLVMSAAAASIQSDFSNATVSGRAFFQSSVTNGGTGIIVRPNGSATNSAVFCVTDSAATNSSFAQFGVNNVHAFVNSGVLGAGTQLPLDFTLNGTVQAELGTAGNWTFTAATSGVTMSVAGVAGQAVATFTGNFNNTMTVNCQNAGTGANAIAGFFLSTGTANSTSSLQLNDSAGSPTAFWTTGSAVSGVVVLANAYTFNNQANNKTFASINANGQMVLGPPASGAILTVNAVSLSSALVVASSGAVSIGGSVTNDSAAAGFVGELITANAAAVPMSNGSNVNITSISVTAGDWDIWGSSLFLPTGTFTNCALGVSSTSAVQPANGLAAQNANCGNSTQTLTAPMQRFSFASTTTVYLVGTTNFSTGSVNATGFIFARRRR